MRIGVATLVLSFAVFSLPSTANSADQSTPAAATSSANCQSVPPKVKARPAPTPIAQSANPTNVVQVCAPVFSPPLVPAAAPLDTSQPLPSKAEPLSDFNKSPTNGEVESVNSFRFKIKDILEAEVNSGSRWLIWSVVAIFALFAALIVLVAKSPVAKSVAPWVVWLVGVVIVAALMLFAVPRWSSNTTSPVAIDKLIELYSSGSQTAANESIYRLELQIDQLRRDLREGDGHMATIPSQPSRAEAQPSSPGLILHTFVFGILAATVAIAAMLAQVKRWGVRRWLVAARDQITPTPTTAPIQESLPLDAIFRLEDELSMLAMGADKTYRSDFSDEKPSIPNPSEFLRTINIVRRKLEGQQTTGEDSEYLAPLWNFHFKEDMQRYEFGRINTALQELDKTLASRYESEEKKWRPRALAALARARRELIAVCEPASETLRN